MDNLDFSEEEIQEQLALLGYKNIPKHRLREFKQDLDELIQRGEWKSLASPTQTNTKSQTATAHPCPPAYTKEKVSLHCFEGTRGSFFLHAGNADHGKTLTSWQHGDCIHQHGCRDSYAQHSVAQKIQLPPGAPSRLQVEQDREDSLQSPLTDSYTSTPDTQERRFIRRKVLRKHQGESLVCDESVYSEDSASSDHTLHTPQWECMFNMYKLCNTQWEEESEDDKNSLSSSFWSDGDKEEEEEEVEPERMLESKPAADEDDSLQGASEEVKPELNNQRSFSSESLDEGSNDDEEEEEEEECSSSSDSPAPSLMTSGYGTYKAEEQEGAEYRDDHTIAEFDQDSLSEMREDEEDSRGGLSEMREDEEDSRSLSSFGDFLIGAAHEPEDSKYIDNAACCREDGPHDDIHITEVTSEQEEKQADEEKCDLYAASGMKEEHDTVQAEDKLLQDLHEFSDVKKEVGGQVESEDPDESSSNKDIRFIDSGVNISWAMCDEMCAQWEGNLRQKKGTASCLEERLAELDLSASPQQDFESESEDVTSQSDAQSSEGDGASLSAFESYMRGMTQSDGDLRPKPKSFIRPVMSQQTIKKTDPVAKYFQYKQLWEMFKLSGEKDRRALRWEIKERLAYQPPPPKPQRVFVPNTYVVPTEKKRSALRWRIRNDLATGLLPHKFS